MVGKKCQPQYKNNRKMKFYKACNSETKSHRQYSVNIKNSYFDVLFQIRYQPFLIPFEIFFDDVIAQVNSAVVSKFHGSVYKI